MRNTHCFRRAERRRRRWRSLIAAICASSLIFPRRYFSGSLEAAAKVAAPEVTRSLFCFPELNRRGWMRARWVEKDAMRNVLIFKSCFWNVARSLYVLLVIFIPPYKFKWMAYWEKKKKPKKRLTASDSKHMPVCVIFMGLWPQPV